MFGLGALSFTAPLILLALASLPVIWLLLRATPPSPQRVRFPAFIILRKLKGTEETPDRTPWQLLLLRLLLAAFVILGLAGPVLNAPAPSISAGPLIIAVDDSFAAAPVWRLRRDALRQAAEEAVQSGRQAFLLTTAPRLERETVRPLTGEELRDFAGALRPQPLTADHEAALANLAALTSALGENAAVPEIRWLSDGVRSAATQEYAEALSAIGSLTVFSDNAQPQIILRALPINAEGTDFRVERLSRQGAWQGALVAAARNGRELAREPVEIPDGEKYADATIDLPLALRNDIAAVRIEGVPSAGAVQLADARNRRSLVGLLAGADANQDALLAGSYYVTRALEPYAKFVDGGFNELIEAEVSVIVLDDVGRLRSSDVEALTEWVERGGVLVRFAGATLAEAAQDSEPPLLPVSLRGGGRAFGGALSWETPQPLGEFSDDSPFADLVPPGDVFVRRQVLAAPGGETSVRTWASLTDGTPLVTGVKQGDGVIVMFHVTATPDWSDLPLSAVFIEMLRKLMFLSVLGPDSAETENEVRFSPLRLLDGFGAITAPSPDLSGVTALEANEGPTPDHPPGFYGAPEAPLAINAVRGEFAFEPLTLNGANMRPFVLEPPVRIAPPLFAIAVVMLIMDGLATLFLSGRLRAGRAMAASVLALTLFAAPSPDAFAQPLDPEIDLKAANAAKSTRLAYVRTGDAQTDRIAERGLQALSRELTRRTAIEPAPPNGVDPETDDLSVYPLLYWPVSPGAQSLSDAALANVENFMRFGGLIVFDTRDDERAIAGLETPERAALKAILNQIDIPPLTPLPEDHVLTRSFYLLGDLPGRMQSNPVWVQAGGGANDSVTPLIIGGRDWAGAWATDNLGRPILPIARRKIMDCTKSANISRDTRECAYRVGVNMVMVALTGNYKSDQVHTPILLERLGKN